MGETDYTLSMWLGYGAAVIGVLELLVALAFRQIKRQLDV